MTPVARHAHEGIRMQTSRTTLASQLALVACFCALQGCVSDTVVDSGDAAVEKCAPVFATPAATSAAIASTLESIKQRYRLNAIILGVEQDGRPLYRTALGVSTAGVPATTDMHFRVGGVGWQLLSTVLLRMVERDPGRLALTDRVSQWYPDYPNADRATVRMLAASSAGFGEYIDTVAFLAEVEANPLRVWTADDLIAYSVPPYRMPPQKTPQFDNPGQDWAYSHTDFVVLGAVLEKAGGRKYADLLQELVLDPLGLRNMRFQLDARPQLPVLHTLQEGDFQDSTYWNPSFVSWAALTSDICDLGTWNRAFGTGSLLSPGMRGETVAPVNVGLGGSTAQGYFGLGTLVYPPWIVQRAAYWGMYTTTAYDPTTGTSLVATVSLSPGTPKNAQPSNEIITEISELLTPDHPVPR
jgi:D-alanyl-D-alanine carboxypeptidase